MFFSTYQAYIAVEDRGPKICVSIIETTMATKKHIEKTLWACDVAEHVLSSFEAVFPMDPRPRKAIQAGRSWAAGNLSVADARKAAFAAHAAARKAKSAHYLQAEAAARSAGHAAATAHVISHAPHAANYALKAVDHPEVEKDWQVMYSSKEGDAQCKVESP